MLVSNLVPVLARVIYVSRDPAVYIFLILTLCLVHLAVWLLVRDYTDVEWWRSGIIGMIGCAPLVLGVILIQQNGLLGLGVAVLFTLAVCWWALGWLYELEATWRRGLLSFLIPVIAGIMFPVARLLSNLLLSMVMSP